MNGYIKNEVVMQDGFKVPFACLDALDDLQDIWPGATTVQARPGIVRAVLQAKEKDDLRKQKELKQWNEQN